MSLRNLMTQYGQTQFLCPNVLHPPPPQPPTENAGPKRSATTAHEPSPDPADTRVEDVRQLLLQSRLQQKGKNSAQSKIIAMRSVSVGKGNIDDNNHNNLTKTTASSVDSVVPSKDHTKPKETSKWVGQEKYRSKRGRPVDGDDDEMMMMMRMSIFQSTRTRSFLSELDNEITIDCYQMDHRTNLHQHHAPQQQSLLVITKFTVIVSNNNNEDSNQQIAYTASSAPHSLSCSSGEPTLMSGSTTDRDSRAQLPLMHFLTLKRGDTTRRLLGDTSIQAMEVMFLTDVVYKTDDGEQVDPWLLKVNPHKIVWIDDEDAWQIAVVRPARALAGKGKDVRIAV
ncbi:hypothetical protein DFH27DRAFT_656956 [Peziza echinospora]|nr:hypothetical protein DFH27DRAFT_656956 [Peziza echinospora]